jgi:hypothetical protein
MCRHNGQVGNSLFCRLKCKECEAEPPVVMTEYHRKVICNIEGGAGKSVQINHLNEGIQLVRSKRHYFFVSQAAPSSAHPNPPDPPQVFDTSLIHCRV